MASGKMSETKEKLGITKDQLNPGTDEDNEKYSEIVYKRAGKHRGPNGQKCIHKGVTSEGELEQALESGWSATPSEALHAEPTEEEKIADAIEKLEAESHLDKQRDKLKELQEAKANREKLEAEPEPDINTGLAEPKPVIDRPRGPGRPRKQ